MEVFRVGVTFLQSKLFFPLLLIGFLYLKEMNIFSLSFKVEKKEAGSIW